MHRSTSPHNTHVTLQRCGFDCEFKLKYEGKTAAGTPITGEITVKEANTDDWDDLQVSIDASGGALKAAFTAIQGKVQGVLEGLHEELKAR